MRPLERRLIFMPRNEINRAQARIKLTLPVVRRDVIVTQHERAVDFGVNVARRRPRRFPRACLVARAPVPLLTEQTDPTKRGEKRVIRTGRYRDMHIFRH